MKNMIRVNLLKPDDSQKSIGDVQAPIREESSGKKINIPAIATAVIVMVGLIVFLFISITSEHKRVQKEKIAKKLDLSKKRKVLKKLEKYEKINQKLNLKLDLIRELRNTKKNAVKMMDHLSLNLPERVWLNSLKFSNNQLQLKGSAISQNLIIDFMDNLRGAGEFYGEEYLQSDRNEKNGMDFFDFRINCTFKLTQETSGEPDVQGNLNQEDERYVYDPGNRNDPFWNLLLIRKVSVQREKFAGIAGMLIDEVELESTYKMGNSGFQALVKGPDGKPYILKVGDFLYDGEVIEVVMGTIKFKKSLQMVVDGKSSKIITKTINQDQR
jgi:type IV pilus assembly protein PilN